MFWVLEICTDRVFEFHGKNKVTKTSNFSYKLEIHFQINKALAVSNACLKYLGY
jgi:hypothetical protein